MQSYLEASLAFLESQEMRDYLREELPKFRWAAMDCAVRWTGELTAEEKPLAILSPLVHAKPELGVGIEDCIWRGTGGDGKPWPEVKAAFGL